MRPSRTPPPVRTASARGLLATALLPVLLATGCGDPPPTEAPGAGTGLATLGPALVDARPTGPPSGQARGSTCRELSRRAAGRPPG